MTLIEIYEQQAKYVRDSGYIVAVNSPFSWVSIKPSNPNNPPDDKDEIFLQGDEADTFINGVEEMWEAVQHMDREAVELAYAYPYLECLK